MKEILITSSVLIVAMILLRLMFRSKVSRRLIYGAWLLVALRLLVPIQFGNLNFSVLTPAEPVINSMANIAQRPVSGPSREDVYSDALRDYLSQSSPIFVPEVQEQIDSALQHGRPEQEVYDELLESNKPESILLPEINREIETKVSQNAAPTIGQIAVAVWITGMAAMAAWFAVVNLSFRRKLQRSATVLNLSESKVPVKVSPVLTSPCLFGLWKPTVYVTPGCIDDERMRHHVLTHELTHLRHGDHVWSWVRCLCLCIYWFNPLVWVAASLSRRDCELACDEAVLKQLGEGERLAYGKTLLDMVSSIPAPGQLLETATAMHETKKQLKERMKCIVKKPKVFLTAAIILLMVLTGLVGCTFSGAFDGPNEMKSDPTQSTTVSTPGPIPTFSPTPSPMFFENGLLWVNNNGKLSIIDRTGKYVVENKFDGTCRTFASCGLAAVSVGGKWGFIDQTGEFVIEPQFDYTYGFADCGLAAVCVGDKWGYIDSSGNYVVEPQFVDASIDFDDGLAIVSQNGRQGCVDTTGKIVIEPKFEGFFSFANNGLAAVKLEGKYGYIDKAGEFVIEPQFEKASNFADNGLACVKVDGYYRYIDVTGNFAFDEQFVYADTFNDKGFAEVGLDKGYGFIDKTGKVVSDAQYMVIYGFSNGDLSVARVENGKWGYIDQSGKMVIEAKFDSASSFTDSGLAQVKVDGKYGYIDMSGNYVIQPELTFDYCGNFTEIGLAPVKVNEKYGYIDRTGKIVIEPQFTYASEFYSDGYAKVRDESKKNGIIDQTGKLVVPCEHESIISDFLPG